MNKKFRLMALLGVLVLGAGLPRPLSGQTNPNVRYLHDPAGNLLGSIDANGNATLYEFDGAGRLVAIERVSARGPVDLFLVEPHRGGGVPVGATVTIHGIGFSETPPLNRVTFNGVEAVVERSTPQTIETRVPAGARTGLVVVTSPLGMAVSRNPFRINSCINFPAGLVGWWAGDGNARDLAGAHHGLREGAAAYGPGQVSHAFSFEAPNGLVTVPHRAVLNPGTADFTVDFWMRTSSTGVLRAILNKRVDCGSANFWDIRLLPEGRLQAELAGVLGKEDYVIISSLSVNDGNWHHIALVRQGATARLYIDGQLAGTVDTKSAINIGNTAAIRFGSNPCLAINGTRSYRGGLDEVDWINRALSAVEVQDIFNAGPSGKCKP